MVSTVHISQVAPWRAEIRFPLFSCRKSILIWFVRFDSSPAHSAVKLNDQKGSNMLTRTYNPADYELCTPTTFDYPESIPTNVRGNPVVWRHSAHVGGLFSLHKTWEMYNVPTSHRERLCFGEAMEDGFDHTGYNKSRGIPCCASCERIRAHMGSWCVSCGEFFIRDFYDTRFCVAYPHCFSCLDKLDWDFCPDHASPRQVDYFESTGRHVISPPAGFNPTRYTDEELDDFINNELGI